MSIDSVNDNLSKIIDMLPNERDNARLLEDFEKHWMDICRDLENAEMSMDDVRSWRNRFDLGRLELITELPKSSFTSDIDTRINRIEDKVEISFLKARANYRANEQIRLKESYGFLAPLIYIIFKILGRV